MRKATRKKETKAFSEAVGRALRRAAKAARKTAKDVWDADLCMGKRQGSGEETLSFLPIVHQICTTSFESFTSQYACQNPFRGGCSGHTFDDAILHAWRSKIRQSM